MQTFMTDLMAKARSHWMALQHYSLMQTADQSLLVENFDALYSNIGINVTQCKAQFV
jgi:hypothetical protein